jgi:NADP-dependent 3-hydroxy acid dehydrogenase YdfG
VASAINYMVSVPERVAIADLVILPTRQANAYIQHRT